MSQFYQPKIDIQREGDQTTKTINQKEITIHKTEPK